jgi:hypothetical protein
MYSPLHHFAKAYQDELLREGQKSQSLIRNTASNAQLIDRYLNSLGDVLITLGEKIKCQTQTQPPCTELSRGRA